MAVNQVKDFDIKKVVFSDPQQETIEKGGKKIFYNRMKMWYEKEDNKIYLIPHKLFCFGVQETKSLDDSTKINGYQVNFKLISKPNEKLIVKEDEDGNQIQPSWKEMGADEEEVMFLNILDSLYKITAKKLLEVKNKCGLSKVKNLDTMLEKLSPPYKFSKNQETKMPDYTKSPTLKAKLLMNIKDMNISSKFYDENDEKLNIKDYINTKLVSIPALAIESIYIGDAYVTFQIKLPEMVVVSTQTTNQRLLKPKMIISNTKDNANTVKSSKSNDIEIKKISLSNLKLSNDTKQPIIRNKMPSNDISDLLGSDDE